MIGGKNYRFSKIEKGRKISIEPYFSRFIAWKEYNKAFSPLVVALWKKCPSPKPTSE